MNDTAYMPDGTPIKYKMLEDGTIAFGEFQEGIISVPAGMISCDPGLEIQSDVEHEIWSSWMRYMFSCGTFNPDGTWTMPAEKVERWQRQMSTPYAQLTEREKESDREQVRKHWAAETGHVDRHRGTRG